MVGDKFKVGQEVRCVINSSTYIPLTIGKHYTILGYHQSDKELVLVVNDDGEEEYFFMKRFETVEDEPINAAWRFETNSDAIVKSPSLPSRIISISYNDGAHFSFDANVKNSRILIDKILDTIYNGEV